MTFSQLILSQLADPFRIALLLGLVYTMYRTRAQTGTLIPLAAGILFVAVIIASTLGTQQAEPFWRQVVAGLITNTILVGVILGIWEAVRRFRG